MKEFNVVGLLKIKSFIARYKVKQYKDNKQERTILSLLK